MVVQLSGRTGISLTMTYGSLFRFIRLNLKYFALYRKFTCTVSIKIYKNDLSGWKEYAHTLSRDIKILSAIVLARWSRSAQKTQINSFESEKFEFQIFCFL